MRRSLLLLSIGVATSACGGERTDDAGRAARVAQPVMDGYVDEKDRGVVGLAIDFNGFWFSGHCSGTLIAPNLVMTAHHCVALTQGGGPQGEVICGQTGFSGQGQGNLFLASPETVRPDKAADPHFYRGTGQVRVAPGANDICGYDVSLIILEGKGIPESEATPVVPRIDSSPEPGDEFAAVGFGLTDPNDNNSSGTRMRRDGNVVSCLGSQCASFLNQVKDSEWAGDAPVCPGDSGGPAIDLQGRVFGVVSRGGTGCVSSVYGNVGSWQQWITDTALEAADLGGYDPPFWATTGSSTPPVEPEPDPGSDAGTPEPDPGGLGQSCTGACPAGYLCYTTNGKDGTCVPECSAASPDCPNGYSCAEDIGLCIESSGPATNGVDSGETSGCSVTPSSEDPAKPVPWLIGMAWVAAVVARRRSR